eukprot:scaffold11632_cov34-Isochrysis_galbana.AAC.1
MPRLIRAPIPPVYYWEARLIRVEHHSLSGRDDRLDGRLDLTVRKHLHPICRKLGRELRRDLGLVNEERGGGVYRGGGRRSGAGGA